MSITPDSRAKRLTALSRNSWRVLIEVNTRRGVLHSWLTRASRRYRCSTTYISTKVVNIFLCHTPLHLVITALELPLNASETHVFVIEDVAGMHALAQILLDRQGVRFHTLPGAVHSRHDRSLVAIQKENFSRIRRGLPSLSPSNLYVFFDQRPEAQAFLNFKYGTQPRISLLEDGLSIYKIASPFDRPYRRLLRNKLRFDLLWKGSKWLGQHPRIDEIACFFPEQLRDDLKTKSNRRLLLDAVASPFRGFLENYGPPRLGAHSGIVAVPHPEYDLTGPAFERFIEMCLEYFGRASLQPVFKLHPRDARSRETIIELAPDAQFAPHHLPVELLMLVEAGVEALVGFRTSALHVTSVLSPRKSVFYYEPSDPSDAQGGEEWREFYSGVSVRPLPTMGWSK